MKDNIIDLFSDDAIKSASVAKTVNLFNKFLGEYIEKFPTEMRLEEKTELSVQIWNIGMLSNHKSEAEVAEIFDPESFDIEELGIIDLLTDMFDSVLKKYSSHNRFILEWNRLEDNKSKSNISLRTGEYEDFQKQMDEYFHDIGFEDLLAEDFEGEFEDTQNHAGYIYREAYIVTPLAPFYEWLEENNLEEKFHKPESTIYLLENLSGQVQVMETWLKKDFDRLFIIQLSRFCLDNKIWPQKRTFKMFNKYFKVELCNTVYDLEEFPIGKE